MAGIFEQGKSSSTTETQPSAVNQAKVAAGVEWLKALLTQPGQGFASYLQNGPQAAFPGAGAAFGPLQQAMMNPQNFYARTIQTGTPSAPSTFQDIGSLLTVLALIDKMTGTSGNILGEGAKPGIIGQGVNAGAGAIRDWLFGAGDTAVAAGQPAGVGSFPSEPYPGLGGSVSYGDFQAGVPVVDTGNFYDQYLASMFNGQPVY